MKWPNDKTQNLCTELLRYQFVNTKQPIRRRKNTFETYGTRFNHSMKERGNSAIQPRAASFICWDFAHQVLVLSFPSCPFMW